MIKSKYADFVKKVNDNMVNDTFFQVSLPGSPYYLNASLPIDPIISRVKDDFHFEIDGTIYSAEYPDISSAVSPNKLKHSYQNQIFIHESFISSLLLYLDIVAFPLTIESRPVSDLFLVLFPEFIDKYDDDIMVSLTIKIKSNTNSVSFKPD